jgi:conjugal transfer pilus assembly protein TrbC
MKYLYIVFIVLILGSYKCYAQDSYQFSQINTHNQPQVEQYKNEAESLLKDQDKLTRPYINDVKIAEKKAREVLNKMYLSQGENTSLRNPKSTILIFVSFSMPKQSLIAYLRDGKKLGATIVIRGLVNNSFKKTFEQVTDLVKDSGGDGFEMNPLWFKKFGINTVPSVVVLSENSKCFTQQNCNKENDFDVIVGDINLASAIKIVKDKGQAGSQTAAKVLTLLLR